jgi:hypothetical protein
MCGRSAGRLTLSAVKKYEPADGDADSKQCRGGNQRLDDELPVFATDSLAQPFDLNGHQINP